MADTVAGSAKRKRKSDRALEKTRVNLGQSFNRWRELQDFKEFKAGLELAFSSVDR